MFAIHRPRLTPKLTAIALAAGAAAVTGLIQVSAEDLPAFTCTNKAGDASGVAATISALRIGHHNGYDRLVVEFAGASVPEYQLTRQASSTFIRDASGQPVSLEGSAGIRAVLRNSDIAGSVPSDIKSRLPEIREVANIGNFERVVSYGVGLKDQACFRAFSLSGPARLVIDVQTPPDAVASNPSTSNPPVAATSEPAASSAPAATTVPSLPSDLAATGHPASASQPAGMPIVPILGLLVVTAGLAMLGLRRFGRQ